MAMANRGLFLKISGLGARIKNFLSRIKMKLGDIFPAWPSSKQWRQIFRVLSKTEKIAFIFFITVFSVSLFYLGKNFYFRNTEVKPMAGGAYREGVLGQPRFINPLFSASSDVDRDLVELVFSGLMKYDAQGKIVYDLAKDLKIDEEGRIYEVYLKENVFWHDGQKLTSEDVIFTIKTIQNPEYKSPLRANWLGVKIEKIEGEQGSGIRFELSKPYAAFLERLTFKIIPEHIWQNTPPQNILLSSYNLKPIGSGPYRFKNLQYSDLAIISLDLVRFPDYFDNPPYISQFSFQFFEKEEDLIAAANQGNVDGFSLLLPKNLNLVSAEKFNEYTVFWPRYFAVFFNPKKSKFLAEKNVRQALSYGTNKEEILEKVLKERGEVINSPLSTDFYGLKPPAAIYSFETEKAEALFKESGFEKTEGKLLKEERAKVVEFKSELTVGDRGKEVENLQSCLSQFSDIYKAEKITGYFGEQTKETVKLFQEKYAKEILEPQGFKAGTGIVGKGTRTKLNEICNKKPEPQTLKLSLITVKDFLMEETANLLGESWEKLGVEVQIEALPIGILENEFIKTRNYDALLFGEGLGSIPDLFPFWHSSQVKDPGLNLTGYESKEADKLLEEARTTLDQKTRIEKYESFQNILTESAPAIFLYRPDYIYLVSENIKGIEIKIIVEPAKRFAEIENWYIKTKRVWK